jgi:hypothetical protein
MKTVEVEIKAGKIVLQEPPAGVRNKAMVEAETPQGIKMTQFLVSVIPDMVKEHPFGAQPIKKALDNLSITEYDKLVDATRELMQLTKEEDTKKKSKSVSN